MKILKVIGKTILSIFGGLLGIVGAILITPLAAIYLIVDISASIIMDIWNN